jgi:hypothetical protein
VIVVTGVMKNLSIRDIARKTATPHQHLLPSISNLPKTRVRPAAHGSKISR